MQVIKPQHMNIAKIDWKELLIQETSLSSHNIYTINNNGLILEHKNSCVHDDSFVNLAMYNRP